MLLGVLNFMLVLGFFHRLSPAHHPPPVRVKRPRALAKLPNRRRAPSQRGWTVKLRLRPNRWVKTHSPQSDLTRGTQTSFRAQNSGCVSSLASLMFRSHSPPRPIAHAFITQRLTTETWGLLRILHRAPGCVPLHSV